MCKRLRRSLGLLVALCVLCTTAPSEAASSRVDAATILRRLGDGANLEAFGKKYVLSESRAWVRVDERAIGDKQTFFDDLVAQLRGEKKPQAIVAGGLLAVELDRSLGGKRANRLRLVEWLASQLNHASEVCRLFALRSLTDDYFPDAEVFTARARKEIYRAASRPSLVQAFAADVVGGQRSLIMLIAKAGHTKEGRNALQAIRKANPSQALLCRAALARLGDKTEQKRLLMDFTGAQTLKEKYLYAYALGHWGGREAQIALAKALRTPGTVKAWRNPSRPAEMIALHIAIAFVRTIHAHREELPERGCFAWTEQDFGKIERWATKHLGVRWTKPRPKYEPVKIIKFPPPRPAR